MFRGLPTASLPLVQLYASPYLFTIPAYQRPYSWTTKEASQLLEDVSLAAGLSDAEPATPDYFLGAILLLDPEGDSSAPPPPFSGPRQFEVVDGQQRLVTLAIMASILRDLEDQDGPPESEAQSLAGRLDAMVSPSRDERDITSRRSRIQLNSGEQAFLEAHILARHPRAPEPEQDAPGENGIQTVHEQLWRELEGLGREERRRLATFLIEDCHVVVIITREIDRAHRLFTVLNERGKPLDRKDILKAEVLRKLPANSAGKAIALWETAQNTLGPEFENFFSHLKTIYGNQKLPIIASVRSLVREHGSEQFVENVLTPLADGLNHIRSYDQNPQILRDPALTGALVSLNRLAKSDWVPAAMLAMSSFEAAPERTSAVMVEIERLAFIVRILGLGADKRQRRFAGVVDAIKAGGGDPLASTAFDIAREEQRTVTYHLKDIHRRNAPLAKLLLMRIEDDLAGTPLNIDPAALSVEHVLPQRPAPTSNWRKLFPEAEVREVFQNSLGNLCLVTSKQNERAKNREIAEKLAIYRDGVPGQQPFVSNRIIFEAKSWHTPEIKTREAVMLNTIARIWRIETIPAAPVPKLFAW